MTVEVGGLTYLYDQGIFWLQQGSSYIVVTAPVGAVVDRLPQGVTRIQSRPGPVWYFFGTFFGEKDGAYEVIKPPAGLTVFYLPDGYTPGEREGRRAVPFRGNPLQAGLHPGRARLPGRRALAGRQSRHLPQGSSRSTATAPDGSSWFRLTGARFGWQYE